MKNKLGLILISVMSILALVLAGCAASGTTEERQTGNVGSSTISTSGGNIAGQIQVRVTDAPAAQDVTSIKVTVDSVEVHEISANGTTGTTETTETTSTSTSTTTTSTTVTQQGQGNAHGNSQNPNRDNGQNQNQAQSQTSQSNDSGWITVPLSGSSTFDLLQVKDLESVLATGDLTPGTYTQIRMEVSKVVVGFKDGTSADAKLPSGKLRFVTTFDIAAGKTTVLLFDFNAAKSIIVTGNGQVIFKPVIKLSVTRTPGKIQITTDSLPNGEVNTSYTTTLTAIGGTAPYSWTITGGTIPGLTLTSGTGVLSGTPVTAGDYSITVQAADSSAPVKTDTATFQLNIAAAGALQIITTDLPGGTVGDTYTATVQSVGGVAPVTWSVLSGDLPAGLTLNSGTGVISGSPTAHGKFTFTVKATDSTTPTAATDTQSLTIQVSEAISA